jgi:hypothetical protein
VLILTQDRCTVCAERTIRENHFRRNRWYCYMMSVMWKPISVHLEIVLISKQDRCMVCADCTMGMEIILGTPKGTARWHGWNGSSFSPFGDSVNLDVWYMHGLRRTYHELENHFWRNRWHSYMTWVKWKLVSVHLEIVLMSSVECTIGSKIIWDATNCTPRWRGSSGSSFWSVWR